MKIKIINKSNNQNPSYQTSGSSGMDLRAFIPSQITLHPGDRLLVPTGIFLEIPEQYEAQIRSRSGLALKKGITVLNSPGTIDADYRGEIGVILVNLSNQDFIVKPGERVAQLVIAKYEQIKWKITQELSNTIRGDGGFGSTGKK